MIKNSDDLRHFLDGHRTTVEGWFGEHWQDHPVPFYCSIDIRDSGFKWAPVDANLFPAGFNNVHQDCHAIVSRSLLRAAGSFCADLNGILLVAERVDNNPHYLEHLWCLQKLLIDAGIPVRLVRSDVPENAPLTLQTASGKDLIFYPLSLRNNRLWSGSWSPCAVLLNDDLSRAGPKGIEMCSDIEQTILPLPALGWFQRRKSDHFRHYNEIVNGFCQKFDIDPWLLDPMFRVCAEVDIGSRVGLDCVASHCEMVLAGIEQAYRERNIDARPTCFVKSDYGTHGLGVIQIDDPGQVFKLNRKQRKAMSYDKSGKHVNQVIIQECVPSRQRNRGEAVAEHVFYTVHHRVVGGFMRAHADKSAYQSLNSPGMFFTPVSWEKIDKDYFYLQVVAMLSLLAAAREEIDKTTGPEEALRRLSSAHRRRQGGGYQAPAADAGIAGEKTVRDA